MGLEEKIQKLDKSAETLLEKSAEVAEKAEATLNIGIYVGQKKRLEAQKIAYALERKGYDIAMINSEGPNDLDISINGVMFNWDESDRIIKMLIGSNTKKEYT
jgi:hypothetical protein